jgi:hypothetical protein
MSEEDFSKGKLKKTKRKEDEAASSAAKAKEEEEPELDKDGRPIIKFKKVDVTQVGNRKLVKKKEGKGKPGIKNETLLSFGDDGDE